MISLIFAVSANGVIGNNGKLPWHISSDLKRFKNLTNDNVVVMGRKTYESIGKPLSNRFNVILTRDKKLRHNGCLIAHNVEDILALNNSQLFRQYIKKDIFIIGGSEVFKEFFPHADKMYVTSVKCVCPGDVFMNISNWTQWKKTYEKKYKANLNDQYDFSFEEYDRIEY